MKGHPKQAVRVTRQVYDLDPGQQLEIVFDQMDLPVRRSHFFLHITGIRVCVNAPHRIEILLLRRIERSMRKQPRISGVILVQMRQDYSIDILWHDPAECKLRLQLLLRVMEIPFHLPNPVRPISFLPSVRMAAQIKQNIAFLMFNQDHHDRAMDQLTRLIPFVRAGQHCILQKDVLVHQQIAVVQNIDLHFLCPHFRCVQLCPAF